MPQFSKLAHQMRKAVVFYLNGGREEVTGPDAFKTLAEYLRQKKGLTGTKIVCAEGDCGACTVLRAFVPPGKRASTARFESINSCISLVAQIDGSHLVTIEGLEEKNTLHPAQQAMIDCHGSQCGYCTPGFVMALSAMTERHSQFHPQVAKNYLTGNLCRCTGYQPILAAAERACQLNKENKNDLSTRYLSSARLKELSDVIQEPVEIVSGGRVFFAPTNLKDLRTHRKKHPQSRLLGAASDLGVAYNKGKDPLTHLVSLHLIGDCYDLKVTSKSVRAGARVTLATLRRALGEHPVGEALNLFAAPQIKNVATLIGNVANASPIADTPPVLLALNAKLEILSPNSAATRSLPLEEFFVSYRKTSLKAGEVITAIEFDLPQKSEVFKFYKSSQRKDLDISTVNAAIWLKKNTKGKISDVRLAYGGVAPIPLRLRKTEAILKTGDQDSSLKALHEDISPISDLRGSLAFRRVLSENILRRLLSDVATA